MSGAGEFAPVAPFVICCPTCLRVYGAASAAAACPDCRAVAVAPGLVPPLAPAGDGRRMMVAIANPGGPMPKGSVR